jgi:hypothetical protein
LGILKSAGSALKISDKIKMKKLTIILIVLFAVTIKTNAQVPNNGFETWEDYTDGVNVYQKPDLWNGSLPYSPLTHSFSIEKNPESYPLGTGQYSMKIKPDIANGVRGVAISNDGADAMVNWIPKPSFAINQRPASLFLYYKCFPFGGDTIVCTVFFYKNGVVIGMPSFGTTDTISTWTALEVPMTYNTSDVPDSATILFVTGAFIQHTESTMYVDNLSFDGFVTSIPEKTSGNTIFNLYPNPASDIITLNIDNKNNDDLTLNVYNVSGTLVKSEMLKQNQRQINIWDLCNGVYVVEITSKEWTEQQKLTIQR